MRARVYVFMSLLAHERAREFAIVRLEKRSG